MDILLLEDNVALNRAIKKVLKVDDHNVSSFTDGQAVLNDLDSEYDLYILDINVPNINGLELLDIIYTDNSNSKVMIISSNDDIISLQKAYRMGCIDYLRKPFYIEELRIKINRLNVHREDLFADLRLKVKNDSLTKKEKKLMTLLFDNHGTVVTYAMIEAEVYKDKKMSMDGLRALVRRTRLKLADDIIKNVLEEGYTIS